MQQLVGPSSRPVHLLEVDPNAALIGVARLDGTVVVLDATSGAIVHRSVEYDIRALATLPVKGGRRLTVAAGSRGVAYHRDDGWTGVIGGHDGRPTGVGLADDGTLLVSGDERGNVFVTSIDSGQSLATVRAQRKGVNGLSIVRDRVAGWLVLTFADDREIACHSVPDLRPIFRLTDHAGWVEQARPVVQGGRLSRAVAVDRVGLTVWDTVSGDALLRRQGRVDGPVSIIAEPHLVVGAVLDGSPWVWSSMLGETIVDVPPHRSNAIALLHGDEHGWTAIVTSGDRLLSVGSDGTERERHTLSAPVRLLLPLVRSHAVVCALSDGSVWKVPA